MRGESDFSPWTRNAILAAGLRRQDIEARIPDRCRLVGTATTARGPFRFRLIDERSGAVIEASARGWSGVAEAIDSVLGVPT